MLLNFLTDGAVSEIRGRMWKSTPPKATLSGKRENKKTDSNLGCIFQIALKTNKVHSLCKGFLFHVLFLSSYFYWNIQQAPLPRRELVVLPLLDKWRQYNSHSKIHQCPLKDKSTTFAPPLSLISECRISSQEAIFTRARDFTTVHYPWEHLKDH